MVKSDGNHFLHFFAPLFLVPCYSQSAKILRPTSEHFVEPEVCRSDAFTQSKRKGYLWYQTSKLSSTHHKKSFPARALFSTYCTIFSVKSHWNLNCGCVEKHSELKLCYSNMDLLSNNQILILTLSLKKLMIRVSKESCVQVNISPYLVILKGRDKKQSIV